MEEKKMLPVVVKKQFCYHPYLNVAIDITGSYKQGDEQSALEEMDWLHRVANKWFESRTEEIRSVGIYEKPKMPDYQPPAKENYTGSVTKVIIPAKNPLPKRETTQEEDEGAKEFELFKVRVSAQKTLEEAEAFLQESGYSLSIDAKKFVAGLFPSLKSKK